MSTYKQVETRHRFEIWQELFDFARETSPDILKDMHDLLIDFETISEILKNKVTCTWYFQVIGKLSSLTVCENSIDLDEPYMVLEYNGHDFETTEH